MAAKQKVIMIVMAIVIVIILWQILGLFSNGGGKTPVPTPTPKATTSATSTAPANPTLTVTATKTSTSTTIPAQPQQPTSTVLSDDAGLLKQQQETQIKYIGSLNELQMLKIQRDIAETNQAIAAAKLATATANRSIDELLSKPVQSQIPAGAYGSKLVTPVQTGVQIVSPEGQPPQPPVSVETQYVVISVSMELGRWHAVLGYQGKLYNVSIGDILPIDGSIVASIDKDGVVLKKDSMRRRISLISAI